MVFNTIIIGAGIAGLTAAERLTQKGPSVLLLEARDRLGGRIETLIRDQDTLEIGALALQGRGIPNNPNPLLRFFQEFNLNSEVISPFKSDTFNTASKPCSLIDLFQNLQLPFNNANMVIQEAKRLPWKSFPALAKVLGYPDHPSLPVDSPEYWAKKLITATVVHHTGATLEDVSILDLLHTVEYQGDTEIILNGYQKIIQGLFEKSKATGNLTVKSNCCVREIHQEKRQRVRVVTEGGQEYQSETAICAIPVGVLKKGLIQFFPTLSKEKQQAIHHVKIGSQNVIILEFKKPFWPKDIHYIYPNDPDIRVWPEYINLQAFSQHQTPRLLVNFYAEQAQFGSQPDDHLVEISLKPLRNVYGKAVTQPLHSLVSRWDTDPYTIGRSAYYGTECTEEDLDNLSEPEGRVYFAGDYTQRGLQASVNGAYESGLKAALEVEVFLTYASSKSARPKPYP